MTGHPTDYTPHGTDPWTEDQLRRALDEPLVHEGYCEFCNDTDDPPARLRPIRAEVDAQWDAMIEAVNDLPWFARIPVKIVLWWFRAGSALWGPGR